MTTQDRFQVGRFGQGFNGPGQAWLGNALDIVRAKLKSMDGPFTIKVEGREESFERNRKLTIARLHALAPTLPFGKRVLIQGDAWDEPGVIFRRIKDTPDESPFVTEARRYLGLPYVFAQVPSLKPRRGGDCSGLTLAVALTVKGTKLSHTARAQYTEVRRISREDAEGGDLVFYDYPRPDLAPGQISHVAYVVDGSTEIGSRPSTDGVGLCAIDWPWVKGFGRL